LKGSYENQLELQKNFDNEDLRRDFVFYFSLCLFHLKFLSDYVLFTESKACSACYAPALGTLK